MSEIEKIPDDTLIKLLICKAQGLDSCFQECNKVPATGDICLNSGCPFTTDDDPLPEWLDRPASWQEMPLLLMYYAARRLAELTNNPIKDEIKLPYVEE